MLKILLYESQKLVNSGFHALIGIWIILLSQSRLISLRNLFPIPYSFPESVTNSVKWVPDDMSTIFSVIYSYSSTFSNLVIF